MEPRRVIPHGALIVVRPSFSQGNCLRVSLSPKRLRYIYLLCRILSRGSVVKDVLYRGARSTLSQSPPWGVLCQCVRGACYVCTYVGACAHVCVYVVLPLLFILFLWGWG
jgi:hypothetical protein